MPYGHTRHTGLLWMSCINRSIQIEGSFAEVKQDMKFRRYLEKPNVIHSVKLKMRIMMPSHL